MAASRSDQALLANDAAFQGRVRQSMVAAAIAIASEGWGVVFHRQREQQCQRILTDQNDTMKVRYAISVATDASVIADATQAGTVVLTAGNTIAQAALVTDAHIDAAISGQFNAFFETIT
jgi:hypothetical protein